MEISEILKKYDTDKVKGHHYGVAYDKLFSLFDRNAEINILEIGTQRGGSLAAWREYFPNAKITGIDIVDCVTEENKREDIDYVICDVNKYETDEMFDIVIDDGSHWLKDVVPSVYYFTRRLKPGGVMIVEDVQNHEVYLPAIRNILSYQLSYNEGLKFEIVTFDVTSINNQADDFLIIIQRL